MLCDRQNLTSQAEIQRCIGDQDGQWSSWMYRIESNFSVRYALWKWMSPTSRSPLTAASNPVQIDKHWCSMTMTQPPWEGLPTSIQVQEAFNFLGCSITWLTCRLGVASGWQEGIVSSFISFDWDLVEPCSLLPSKKAFRASCRSWILGWLFSPPVSFAWTKARLA